MTLLLDAARAVTAPLRCLLAGHGEPVVDDSGVMCCGHCGRVLS